MSSTEQSDINTLGFASLSEGLQKNFKLVEEVMADFASSHQKVDFDAFNLAETYQAWLEAVSKDPQKLVQASMDYWQRSMELSQQAFLSFWGSQAQEVVPTPSADRRFRHDAWTEQPIFNAIKQSYLLTSDWMRTMVSDVEGLDDKTSEKLKFFTERYLDALSPTNFAATNPAVIEKCIETKGANLVHGLKNMLQDLEDGKGQLRIRMTDTEAFELGKNVAVTPGKVVFQNRMFQLIQYSPTTDKVLKRPLMIVPPWINKFYILDLQPKNSMLKWLTDQGHTVFVLSWVNPDSSYAETTFSDYVTDGVVTALDAVEAITGEKEINTVGYCIGGTLLSASLAYMKAKGDDRVESATFFTTMLDFGDPGELGVFIEEAQICGLEKKMTEDGFLDGSAMSGAFNLLRANDLIWSFYINNYLMGNDPRPFDLLYWNSDSTRMPPKMHSFYLRNMYMDNLLCKPNGVSVAGVDVDLRTINVPSCFISTIEDHIAPWKSTYKGAQLFSGDVRFILGGSGHIAGIVNPPEGGKYSYRLTDKLVDDFEGWAESAEVVPGSWWPAWDAWLKDMDGATVDARQPGSDALPPIEDAPGTYVKVKMTDQVPAVEFSKLDSTVVAVKSKAQKPAVKKAAAPKAKTEAAAVVEEAKPAAKPEAVKPSAAKPKAASAPKPKARAKAKPAAKAKAETSAPQKVATEGLKSEEAKKEEK